MSPRQKEPLTYEHALLGFITDTAMHAYAVHLALQRSPLGQVWHIKQSACYAMISRLADESLLDASSDDGAPRGKRVLTITALGHMRFSAWYCTPVAHPRDMRIEFLAKLYFATMHATATRIDLVRAQQHVLAAWYPSHSHRDVFGNDVYRYRRGQIDAIAQWLTTLIE